MACRIQIVVLGYWLIVDLRGLLVQDRLANLDSAALNHVFEEPLLPNRRVFLSRVLLL